MKSKFIFTTLGICAFIPKGPYRLGFDGVWKAFNNVQINGGSGKMLTVVNLTGQAIKNMIVNEDNMNFKLNDGFYVVRVGNEQFKLVIKE